MLTNSKGVNPIYLKKRGRKVRPAVHLTGIDDINRPGTQLLPSSFLLFLSLDIPPLGLESGCPPFFERVG
jgi:hypothetical protein